MSVFHTFYVLNNPIFVLFGEILCMIFVAETFHFIVVEICSTDINMCFLIRVSLYDERKYKLRFLVN